MLLCVACVDDDPFVCNEFCDIWRACNTTVSDARWDACLELCREMDYSRRLVDCMKEKTCEDGFDLLKASCEYDPANFGGDSD